MSFVQRAIEVQFVMRDGTLSDGKSNQIDLTNHRVEAIVDNPGGGLAVGTLHMRIFGMKLADMNAFSTDGVLALAYRGDQVTVRAGDLGGRIQKVFEGTILAAYIDFSASPDVSFNVTAQAGFYEKIQPAAPNSYKGSVDVASTIEALAKSIGFGFHNNGVSVQVANPYLDGTVIDQIHKIADAAGVMCCIENGEVNIWPSDGLRDGLVVALAPGQGLVGYPGFIDSGIAVRAEFSPDLVIGRQVDVTTLVQKAAGRWVTQSVRHELSTMQPGGPWFSTIRLTRNGLFIAGN